MTEEQKCQWRSKKCKDKDLSSLPACKKDVHDYTSAKAACIGCNPGADGCQEGKSEPMELDDLLFGFHVRCHPAGDWDGGESVFCGQCCKDTADGPRLRNRCRCGLDGEDLGDDGIPRNIIFMD